MPSDLFAEFDTIIAPWKPQALKHADWPPDYRGVYAWRINMLDRLRNDETLMIAAMAYYASHPSEFIMHWMDTYNPRKDNDKWIPFVFFARQVEFIDFLENCRADAASGLVEKCRDAGATWLSCAYSVHSWLFKKNDAIGWGSRKQDLVDKLGNPDSIFEKMRLILRRLPREFLPITFSFEKHATFLRIVNPQNGSIIMGEAGDNIGRGGRTGIYFKDESAHYERPEKIEAALGDNTNVQIDISSVNGVGNVFHRRRKAGVLWRYGATFEPGKTRVFIIDWRDHPEKTQEWYDIRRAKFEREGMLHLFKQEVDRDYSGAISNTIIPSEWIDAIIDAHKIIPILQDIPNTWGAGLDVADEGIDRNAISLRQGVVARMVEEWGERDPGVTARRAMGFLKQFKGIRCQYDSIGIGSNVKSEFNRLSADGTIKQGDFFMVPWNAGARVLEPSNRVIPDDDESPMNKDFFHNMKAQAWWSFRTRCFKTYQYVMAIRKGEPVPNYTADELVSLDGTMPLLQQLVSELAQPTRGVSSRLQMLVNKKPDGTASPNLADAVIMMYFPVPDDYSTVYVGVIG